MNAQDTQWQTNQISTSFLIVLRSNTHQIFYTVRQTMPAISEQSLKIHSVSLRLPLKLKSKEKFQILTIS